MQVCDYGSGVMRLKRFQTVNANFARNMLKNLQAKLARPITYRVRSCKSVRTPFADVPSQQLDALTAIFFGFALATLTLAQNRLDFAVSRRRL
jgi:hypothetical protein